MSTTRLFTTDDFFRFGRINLDPLTETYSLGFYFNYLARWPEYFTVVEAANTQLMGYVIGKAEGQGTNWHGHVSALTVSPTYRRLGLAVTMMKSLELISDCIYKGYFVDLFVRASNNVAVGLYEKLGYVIYRTVIMYYSESGGLPAEDGYDMRKALSRDPGRASMIPLTRPVRPEELEHP